MIPRLRNWLRRAELERGLDRELRYHLDRRVGDLVAAGVPEREVRRRAVLELGGVAQVREEVRDVWLARWLREGLYDVRFAVRFFAHSPAFAAAVVISLGLGIGATTALYSMVDQVILHALPVRHPERLVLIDWKGDQAANGFGSYNLKSYPICRDLALQERFFDGVLCRAATLVSLSVGGEPRPAAAEIVSGTYFPVLGVRPALGRVLGPDDDAAAGASPVVVLSYDFWKSGLAAAPDVLGRKVLVNGHPMTVVGVAARRTREIGIRMALGATSNTAIGLMLRDAVAMIAAGTVLALPCVAALGRLLQSQLFGVTATDLVTFAQANLLLGLAALAAALLPAWRAATVNPTDTLRLD